MNENEKIHVHIRWMIRRDLSEVLESEGAKGWTEEDFLNELRKRNVIGMVAERGEKVIAHMIYELHKNHILLSNICVHPAWRKKGIGRELVEKLKSKLSSSTYRHKLLVPIPEWNLAAQLFFKSQGFATSYIDREYYKDSNVEAYVLEFTLPVPEANVEEEWKELLNGTYLPENRIAHLL
jgi:ribosomal-protein-alanine N-acetyltransferase